MINQVRVDETNRLNHNKPAVLGYQANPLFTAAQSRKPEEAGTTGLSRGIKSRVRWLMHTGQLKGINNGHQTDGVRLPGQRTLFYEDKERLSR
ncbi:hypothetical protein [Pseudomonas sp. IT-P253]|uniref:hypothetical protein n=1 Tax=Pseudomonas sp. IT-P253 TaxID=3026455 RepID=UPI0039E04EC2